MSDQDDRKPTLRLVAENDQSQVDQAAAMRHVERAMRELAANIIRVVRGAGKSHDIAVQCMDVINAVHRYREQVGVWPSSWDLDQALSIRRELSPNDDNQSLDREAAFETAMRGSLQMAASRLVGQLVQERRGENEMRDALVGLMQLRAETRERRMDSEKETGRATSRKKKKSFGGSPRKE